MRQGSGDREGLAVRGDDDTALQHAAQALDMGLGPVGEIAQGALLDLAALDDVAKVQPAVVLMVGTLRGRHVQRVGNEAGEARGIRTVNVVRRSAQCGPIRKLGADVALADALLRGPLPPMISQRC